MESSQEMADRCLSSPTAAHLIVMPKNMSAPGSIPQAAVRREDKIAAVLGLKDLRVGRHYLQDESGICIASIWMDTIWLLRVCPSFDSGGVVGVATAHGEEFQGSKPDGWVKAVVLSTDSIVAQQIDDDPLPAIVSALPLLFPSNSLSFDGVGYELRFASIQIKGTISFSNPVSAELIALERACLRLAKEVSHRSANHTLVNFATTWEQYVHRGA